MNPLQRYAGLVRAGLVHAGLVLAFGLCGCTRPSDPPAATLDPVAATAPPSAATSVEAIAKLRHQADAAVREQRLYAPAGDNAIEYYLLLRERFGEGEAATVALTQLQPYLLIASEQALSRGDVQEGRRLLALLTRIDAAAPSLPRLRAALARAQAEAIAPAHERSAFVEPAPGRRRGPRMAPVGTLPAG